MNVLFTKEGLRHLRLILVMLGLAIAAAAALAAGSYWYLEREMRDGLSSTRALREARVRVEEARRERDNLAASAAIFRNLVTRGILKEESRLDLIERMDRLKARHQLNGLDYEIGAQRPLPLPGGLSFSAVEVLGSRVTVRARALHEGDALAFLQELVSPPRGFNPMSRCGLRKNEAGTANSLHPRVEAECTLEWISLRSKADKRAP